MVKEDVLAELRSKSGCKIKLEDGVNNDSLVRMEGSAEGLKTASLVVNDLVQEQCDEEWFEAWARPSAFPQRPTGGRGEPREERGQRGERPSFKSTQIERYEPQQSRHREPRRSEQTTQASGGHYHTRQKQNNLPSIVSSVQRDLGDENRTFPLYVPLPVELKGAVIGKGGCGVKEIIHESHCSSLNIVDSETDSKMTEAKIEGTVSQCAAAYLLLMRRYVNAENYNRNHN